MDQGAESGEERKNMLLRLHELPSSVPGLGRKPLFSPTSIQAPDTLTTCSLAFTLTSDLVPASCGLLLLLLSSG